MLTACGTTDVYQKRAEIIQRADREDREAILKQTPDWYKKLPLSNSAIFAAGQGQADTQEMAIVDAMTKAKAKICYSADGEVTSQTKDFATGSTKTSRIERATRTNCNNVSIAGIEYGETKGDNPKVIAGNSGYIAFVLMALPTGDANVQRKYIDNRKRDAAEAKRSTEAFQELPPVKSN